MRALDKAWDKWPRKKDMLPSLFLEQGLLVAPCGYKKGDEGWKTFKKQHLRAHSLDLPGRNSGLGCKKGCHAGFVVPCCGCDVPGRFPRVVITNRPSCAPGLGEAAAAFVSFTDASPLLVSSLVRRGLSPKIFVLESVIPCPTSLAQNAAYLATQGLGVTDAVLNAISESGFNNQTVKKVMIQSTNSSVLIKFKEKSNYELVYRVDENIRDALNDTILELRKFANSVVISKSSVFPNDMEYSTGVVTDVVSKLQAFNLPAYVQLFSNEFVSQAWDFLSDPYVEINTFVMTVGNDGVITDYPATAAKYRRNRCLGLGNSTPPYMAPTDPGFIMQLIPTPFLPPAEAPNPILTEADVVEPPLPPVGVKAPPPSTGGRTPAILPPPPNGQPKVVAKTFLSTLAFLLATFLLL
ncbi:unnamed protein product [Ilex paraguariensis]|uniref:glycerophosphodiester phosphodiesterase n=1 Tax=Ilex paraguariensis TaxID=185542 RepID=A0ABC8RX16_9AQUA